jgi:hypothetical protein
MKPVKPCGTLVLSQSAESSTEIATTLGEEGDFHREIRLFSNAHPLYLDYGGPWRIVQSRAGTRSTGGRLYYTLGFFGRLLDGTVFISRIERSRQGGPILRHLRARA